MSGDMPNQGVASAYDRWSLQYDADQNATRDLDAIVLRESKLSLENQRVLELGCGTGKNTVWLAAQAAKVTAMDFSDGMLKVARERITASHVTFMRQDIREIWPVASNSVDVVVGNLVLEHVEHLSHIFAEASRVLRSGGTLYICELHPFRQWRGGQAHFIEQTSGEKVHVAAFVHSVSDYINGAISAGFVVQHIGEWLEPRAPADASPRLLAVQFTIAKQL